MALSKVSADGELLPGVFVGYESVDAETGQPVVGLAEAIVLVHRDADGTVVKRVTCYSTGETDKDTGFPMFTPTAEAGWPLVDKHWDDATWARYNKPIAREELATLKTHAQRREACHYSVQFLKRRLAIATNLRQVLASFENLVQFELTLLEHYERESEPPASASLDDDERLNVAGFKRAMVLFYREDAKSTPWHRA